MYIAPSKHLGVLAAKLISNPVHNNGKNALRAYTCIHLLHSNEWTCKHEVS